MLQQDVHQRSGFIMGKIKDINDLVNATFQVKKFFRDTKKQYNLNYEEIYILNHILKSESNEISSKEIATCSEFKPYYLTKALQKLKDLNLLSKKRSVHDERTVIVFVSDEQREKIEKLILELKDKLKLEDTLNHNDGKEGADPVYGNVQGNIQSEAVQALVALGYGNTEALRAVKQIEITEDTQVEEVLKQALKLMVF